MFHLVADVQETKGNEGPTAPTHCFPIPELPMTGTIPGLGLQAPVPDLPEGVSVCISYEMS